MQTALIAGLLAGNALALLGVFVLLRGVSFSGLAVSQLAAMGTVIGTILGLHLGAYWTALACVALGLMIYQRLDRLERAPRDSWIAALYLLAAAGSILLLSKAPHGESHTLQIFFGNLLSLTDHEVYEAVALFCVAVPALVLWRHRLVWITFDPLAAQVAGIPVRRWQLGFFALFAVSMTASIHLFGVMLAFALLLLPAAGAVLWSNGLRTLFVLIPVATTVSVVAGLQLSFTWDFPAGPFIVCLLAGWALASGLVRSFRAN
jgi:iron/zinc/copper transport system substrate-binding protein/iron/zinc/copper transport system permease protein